MDDQKLTHEFIQIIKSDKWMMNILAIVRNLNLEDCWIGAGFIRNKIWDFKHDHERTKLNDIDIIYHNQSKSHKFHDLQIENHLSSIDSTINWSVKNQGRMHIRNGHLSYRNCNEALSFWPETATAIAIRLNSNNHIEYIAPYGLSDLMTLIVRPTPGFETNLFRHRVSTKNWKNIWPKLVIRDNCLI